MRESYTATLKSKISYSQKGWNIRVESTDLNKFIEIVEHIRSLEKND